MLSCNYDTAKAIVLTSNESKTNFDSCSLIVDDSLETKFSVLRNDARPNHQEIDILILNRGGHVVEVKGGSPIRQLGKQRIFIKKNSYLFLVFTNKLYYKNISDTCLVTLIDKDRVRSFE